MLVAEEIDIRPFLRLVQNEGVDVAVCVNGDTIADGAMVFDLAEGAGLVDKEGLTTEGRKLLATLQ